MQEDVENDNMIEHEDEECRPDQTSPTLLDASRSRRTPDSINHRNHHQRHDARTRQQRVPKEGALHGIAVDLTPLGRGVGGRVLPVSKWWQCKHDREQCTECRETALKPFVRSCTELFGKKNFRRKVERNDSPPCRTAQQSVHEEESLKRTQCAQTIRVFPRAKAGGRLTRQLTDVLLR